MGADEFYDKVGTLAETHGVMINLVTIAGAEANIQCLSRMCELSGGQIEQVQPHELEQDFAAILSQKAIATKVEAKVKLHKGLQFRNELEKDLSQLNTILTRRFGNVTAESMFTFEYGLKAISELLKMDDLDMSTVTHFPFQAQISYTAMDGSQCLRVITKKLEVSSEREELTQQANADFLQQHVVMKASNNARAGNDKKAQAMMKVFNRKTKGLVNSNPSWAAQRADFQAATAEVYGAMNQQRAAKKMMVGGGGGMGAMAMGQPMMQQQQPQMMKAGPQRKMKAAAPRMMKKKMAGPSQAA